MSPGVELMNSVRYESPSRSEIRIARLDAMIEVGMARVRLEVGHWLDVGNVVELASWLQI
jgi:hypothetical protein